MFNVTQTQNKTLAIEGVIKAVSLKLIFTVLQTGTKCGSGFLFSLSEWYLTIYDLTGTVTKIYLVYLW